MGTSRNMSPRERKAVPISCREVRVELAGYMEDDISEAMRERIERHFTECSGCQATYDSLRNVIRLVAYGEIIELPEGLSRRLLARLSSL